MQPLARTKLPKYLRCVTPLSLAFLQFPTAVDGAPIADTWPRLVMTWAHDFDPFVAPNSVPDVPAGANDYHALAYVKHDPWKNKSPLFVGTNFGVGAWMPRRIKSSSQ